jgi:phosphoribosylformimino-5-aminoimidazole carboxamide ribotide isomerase
MGNFTVYPAIDLRYGRVVRLAQGDPDQETSYASQPARVARQWQDAGTTWLHVVNLDGVFGESGAENIAALAEIASTGLQVQFGGGMRDMASIHRAFDLGVQRVVLGTAAVHNPTLLEEALAEMGADRLVLGIDAREGIVRVRGWQESTQLQTLNLASRWSDMGGRWLVFTDISRDGMGSGVNVQATADLARQTGLQVIASGGVGSLSDVRRVMAADLSGVIIGRALYEGHVDLRQAIALAAT